MTALNFALGGITSLFLGLSAAYLFSSTNWTWKQFSFPKLFLVSSIVLVASSFTLEKALSAFKNDDQDGLKKYLTATIIFAILFVITQSIGWIELQNEGIFMNGKPNGSYLYLISGVHALHVIGGILPLSIFFIKTIRSLKDPVESLIMFSSPDKLTSFKMITRYWHFVDFLWIYLLFFFLFNHL